MCLVKQHSLLRDSVQIRCRADLVAIGTNCLLRLIVSQDEEKVWTLFFCGTNEARERKDGEYEEEKGFHNGLD